MAADLRFELESLTRLARSLNRFKRRHGRMVGAGVAVLAGSLSALALAVAPLAPDAADLPQRVITESVEPLDVAPQLEALAAHPLELSRTVVVRGPDTLQGVLRRAGLSDPAAAAQLNKDVEVVAALKARGTRSFELRSSSDGQLLLLRVRQALPQGPLSNTHFQRVTAQRFDDRWVTQADVLPLTTSPRFASGTISSSLFAAADDVGLPDAVATQLAEIFSGDIDFHRQLRKGDTFSLVYEALTADGEPAPWDSGAGRVLAAEFINAGRIHQAIWFQAAGDPKGGYYDAQGASRKREFLASPLEFSRVTSGFAMRMHPILQQRRAHRGVDYGAPTGTPVRAVGDGVVEFSGVQSGYGKVVEIRHAGDRSTVYAHLSRIDVRRGQRVEQGSRIGAVGATGLATGPHLHFEFRVAGVHKDPLLLARQREQVPLEGASLERFGELARSMRVKLDWAFSTVAGAGQPRFE
jgi:murein DD-endopeptidase MepM/ murein hydrolase activator NlpD